MIINSHKDIIESYNLNRLDVLKHINQFINQFINQYYELGFIDGITMCDYLRIVPLPSKLQIKHLNNIKYVEIDGKYISYKHNNYIITTNICIPHYSISPIPFTVPYISNDMSNGLNNMSNFSNIKLIRSNVYYYELSIDKNPFTESWSSMNVSIGFGTPDTDMMDNILGWSNNSIGYNSFNGSIYGWGQKDRIYLEYGKGDTVGAGIIYCTHNEYKVFFTLNGKLNSDMIKFNTDNKIIPMIGLNYNAMIKINFNNAVYMYDYTEHILPIVITSSNSFINKEYDDTMYKYSMKQYDIYTAATPLP
jgi:hypothetical protein